MSCYSLKRLIKSFEEIGSLEAKPRSGRPSTCKSVAVTVLQNAEAIETLSTYGEVLLLPHPGVLVTPLWKTTIRLRLSYQSSIQSNPPNHTIHQDSTGSDRGSPGFDNILEGDSITYFSSDSIDDETPEDNESYPPVFLNSLNPSGMPLHKLKL
ncbi:hypothetical protein LAZ67_X003759 [Cordylochernes scorpioides]|uniref:ATP-dependent DNA helicase n=1 Tax=Cordylochernes scorpioides TaxID=51811 RepID=A0ABY6LUV8_9ARAC|nr:hypothetical protein LAZ67_X003759 [Cordylochernes scorpioides]